MNTDDMFGNTPFDKALAGATRRCVILSTAAATKQLIERVEDIEEGMLALYETIHGTSEYPVLMKAAKKDMKAAAMEFAALANLLEVHMGISA